MKTTMKKTAAYLLALVLMFQIAPVSATTFTSNEIQSESELREVLRIINESGPSILKGQTLQLQLPEGYDDAKWSSSNESIAKVDKRGLVTAIEVGTVTITVKSGDNSSTTRIDVVAPVAQEKGSGKKMITVLVNGSKVKANYDGRPHEITYSFTSDSADFDESQVILNREKPSRTIPGAVRGDLTAEDFSYGDEDVDATFIVKDGSIYIMPLTATVKADDLTIPLGDLNKLNSLQDLKLTATVTGLLEGESVEYTLHWPEEKAAGEYEIVPVGGKQQGGYEVEYIKGKLTITDEGEKAQNLYNLLKIDGDNLYYRLKITSIVAEAANKIGMGKTLKEEQYTIPDGQYNFSNLVLSYKGEDYQFSAKEPEGEYESCYIIKSVTVTTNARITGDDKWFQNSSGFLDGSEAQYKEQGIARATPGFHRDYVVKLYKGKKIEKKITISSDWPSDKIAYPGAVITLTAKLTGYGEDCRIQWQYSEDKETWNDEPGANALTFTYTLDATTARYFWRVTVD